MSSEVLLGEDLRVSYRERVALSVERIALREGEILGILGPNGAGKSTLMRVLALLQPPTAGRVWFRGRTGASASLALRRASAAVFQKPHLWSGSVAHNVALGLRFRRAPSSAIQARVRSIAELLAIETLLDEPAANLSGGEAQRVALARALILEPEVLFLDEPTSSLDVEVRAALRQDIERLARTRAGSTLLVTHDRQEAFSLADRIAVLEKGRLVQIGSPADLYEDPATLYIASLTGAEFAVRGRVTGLEDGLLSVSVDGVSLWTVGTAEINATVKVAYRPEDLVLTEPSGDRPLESTRNAFFSTVSETRVLGGLVRVRLEGPPDMVALVTRPAAERLDLRAGSRVSVRIKATALHAFEL
ncbi:MAG: ABC transporter ATP-binding protein [Gemmatimonadota bacterium]|nr:MAG: ABC transporter ATP-binding protein [Gemmatimonadota bacterium]